MHMRSAAMAMGTAVSSNINCLQKNKNMVTLHSPLDERKGRFCFLKPVCCNIPLQQQPQQEVVEEATAKAGIMCLACSGVGWLICNFCNGQKTNVTAPNRRIYRRCPSCKAIGWMLCSNCKVFKCVNFPNREDGEDVNF